MKSCMPNPNPGLRIVEKNKWLFRGLVLLAALLCMGTVPAKADEPPLASSYLAWACWLGDQSPVNIICIHDRAQTYQVAPDNPDDELGAAILDQIYERILTDKTEGLEAFAQEHNEDLRMGEILIITIWSAPYKESWDENRPQRLVAAGLCPRNIPCTVILHRPTP